MSRTQQGSRFPSRAARSSLTVALAAALLALGGCSGTGSLNSAGRGGGVASSGGGSGGGSDTPASATSPLAGVVREQGNTITDAGQAVSGLGGTLSGEHGIGVAKREFMRDAFDPATLAAMRAVKAALDPDGILNPGKVLPPD